MIRVFDSRARNDGTRRLKQFDQRRQRIEGDFPSVFLFATLDRIVRAPPEIFDEHSAVFAEKQEPAASSRRIHRA